LCTYTWVKGDGMTLPTSLNYPIIAIADLHGQLDQLKRLVTRLEMVSEWNGTRLSLTHWALRCYGGKHRHID
jgi:hypothetical protein